MSSTAILTPSRSPRPLGDRAVEALQRRGHEVRITDLYADGFDPVLSAEERARHLEPGADPAVAGHAADLQWCEQLVLVYPTWWSGQPAMLKGWIDRVWVKDIAFDLPPQSSRVRARLHNVRRLVAITTHGSSKLVNALEGETGKRTITRTLRAVCHPLARTTWIAMYGVDTSNDEAAAGLPRSHRAEAAVNEARLARLREELAEVGFELDPTDEAAMILLAEVDYALRPHVHERRVPSVGAIIEPTTPVDQWEMGTQLTVTTRPVEAMPLSGARLFADGLSSWIIRRVDRRRRVGRLRPAGGFGARPRRARRGDGRNARPAPPERVGAHRRRLRRAALGRPHVAQRAADAVVDRRASRCAGCTATATSSRRCSSSPCTTSAPAASARSSSTGPTTVRRRSSCVCPPPPPLDITRPTDLAPLRHALAQIDGAAVFDADGILRQLGVRLVPSAEAEASVEGLRGMRHTSGRRYSFDDAAATVIVVSEDGPVTVLRNGKILGTSR